MNKMIILSIALLILGSCIPARLSYLPEPDAVGLTPYGSYISLHTKEGKTVYGELIALEGNNLAIGNTSSMELSFVDTSSVEKYFIQFCKYKSYEILNVLPISHGWWMVFTFPINAIISGSLRYADKKESRYFDLNFNALYEFSRYPSGLPEGFTVNDYKPAVVSR